MPGKPSPVPAILTIGVTAGYFAVLIGMLAGKFTTDNSPVMLMMLGSLTTAWGGVMAYWFNTTRESGKKTDIIARSGPVQPPLEI